MQDYGILSRIKADVRNELMEIRTSLNKKMTISEVIEHVLAENKQLKQENEQLKRR